MSAGVRTAERVTLPTLVASTAESRELRALVVELAQSNQRVGPTAQAVTRQSYGTLRRGAAAVALEGQSYGPLRHEPGVRQQPPLGIQRVDAGTLRRLQSLLHASAETTDCTQS